jgi:hypothetical protein
VIHHRLPIAHIPRSPSFASAANFANNAAGDGTDF